LRLTEVGLGNEAGGHPKDIRARAGLLPPASRWIVTAISFPAPDEALAARLERSVPEAVSAYSRHRRVQGEGGSTAKGL
jgi:hypothetical protein